MPDKLLERSAAMRAEFFKRQDDLLETLATKGQSPEGLFITCADSRISPSRLFGAKPGDLFTLRNVANIIPPYEQADTGVTAGLEFAVLHLKVPHLIICGHTDCGGIKGLDAPVDAASQPALTRWIEFARPAQQLVDRTPELGQAERHRAIVERNVVQQLLNVQTYPFVLAALEANQLNLHGWVYYLRRRGVGSYNSETNRFEGLGG